jgi:tRNA (adenine57-N1/adenine58-N1)-methyltransferase
MTEHDLSSTSPEPVADLSGGSSIVHPEPVALEGDSVLLVAEDQKRTLIKLQRGQQWHSNRGFIRHDDLIGQPLGRMLVTQLGHAYLVLEPSTHDLIRYIKRTTQIIFSKDAAYLVQRLNLFPGRRVVEAGTGSGGLTLALARAVMPTGRVFSYEERTPMSELAGKNLARFSLREVVELKVRNIADGFDERNVDALFLDMREPWHHIGQAREALKGGGFFGALLPTTNQVSELLRALETHGFADLEVEELLVRPYKPNADRLRPADRMVAHTGYLVFARKVTLPEGEAWRIVDPKRYKARKVEGRASGESDQFDQFDQSDSLDHADEPGLADSLDEHEGESGDPRQD